MGATMYVFLKCLLFLHLHFSLLAGMVVMINKRFGLPGEFFRKLLHMVAVFSIMPVVVPSNSWVASVLVCVVFQLEAFALGRFSSLLSTVDMKERAPGEQQRSMFLLYSTYIFLIINCWGALGQKWMVILSVVAWGVGDAAAALVGKRFGRHKLRGRLIEGTKSVEGSLAMFIMSFMSVFLLYRNHSSMNSMASIIAVCFGIAVFSSFAELFSKNGTDTVVCPCVAMTGFMILTFIVGAI